MSQSSFLEDAASWSAEECQRKLHLALPKLTACYNSSTDSSSSNKDTLRLLCHSFVPVCSAQEIEELVSSQVAQRVVENFFGTFDEIIAACEKDDAFNLVQEEIALLLEASLQVVDCIDGLVSCLLGCEEELEMTNIHSLPRLVIPIIQSSYSHCKNSQDIYKDWFGGVSGPLSTLFKKIHRLQMSFMSLVEKVCLTSPTEQDVVDLCYILNGYFEISQIAGSLDVKIMITMWKAIQRYATQYKDDLWSQLELDPMVENLCCEIQSSFTRLLEEGPHNSQGEDRGFIKNVKVIGFQMKILCALVKDYESCLSASVPHIHQLILTIQRWMPPSLHQGVLPPAMMEEVEKQVAVAIEPLLSHILPNSSFMQSCTARDQDLGDELAFPHLMTLLKVCDLLSTLPEETEDRWFKPKVYQEDKPTLPLLKALFCAFKAGYVELNCTLKLPGVMCKGKPQRKVSLYEHTTTRLCSLIATSQEKHYSIVEETLLEKVLSTDHTTACLAIDVWCFMARYGTAELCRDQCLFLASLLSSCGFSPSPQCCHLVVIVRRLVKFLAPAHQEEFLLNFPIESNLEFWGYINVEFFPTAKQTEIVGSMVTVSLSIVDRWQDFEGKTAEDAVKLTHALHCLHGAYTSAVRARLPQPPNTSLVLRACTTLLLSLTTDDVRKHPVLRIIASSTIDVLAIFTRDIDTKETLQMLSCVSDLLQSCDEVKLSALNFLQSLSKNTFQPSFEQTQLLQLIPLLFRELLGDGNPVIHQTALEVFSVFAEETKHSSIVPESLEGEEAVRDSVVGYLNQLANPVGNSGWDVDVIRQQWTEVQKSATAHKPVELEADSEIETEPSNIWDDSMKSIDLFDCLEDGPAAKRPCTSPGVCVNRAADPVTPETTPLVVPGVAEDKMREELNKLSKSVDTLTEWNSCAPLPPWLLEELKIVGTMLNKLTGQ